MFADFAVGAIIGAYGPVIKRGRDNDCFSKSFNAANGVVAWSKYFDHGFHAGWWDVTKLVVSAGVEVYGIYGATSACVDQLEFSKENEWLEDFAEYNVSFKEFDSYPIVAAGKDGTFELGDAVDLVSIGLKIYGVYSYFKGEFYYYYMGNYITAALFKTIMFADKVFELHIFSPMKPWDRYPVV